MHGLCARLDQDQHLMQVSLARSTTGPCFGLLTRTSETTTATSASTWAEWTYSSSSTASAATTATTASVGWSVPAAHVSSSATWSATAPPVATYTGAANALVANVGAGLAGVGALAAILL